MEAQLSLKLVLSYAYIFQVMHVPHSLFLVAVVLYGDFWTESRKSVKQNIFFKGKLEHIKPLHILYMSPDCNSNVNLSHQFYEVFLANILSALFLNLW